MQQYKRGQVWIAEMPEGKGSEQKNQRPIVIMQNDIGNKFSPNVTVISITGQSKKWMPTHVTLYSKCLAKTSIALAEQINTISKERLMIYIGMINESDMLEVENSLLIQLGITTNKNKIVYA